MLIINYIDNNPTKFTQEQAEESDIENFETARKMNEKKLCICQTPEGAAKTRILANLELLTGSDNIDLAEFTSTGNHTMTVCLEQSQSL